jgi:hypothetical protein
MANDPRATAQLVSAAILVCCALGWSGATDAATAARELHFDVFFDEKRIGDHRFHLTPGEDALRVRSEADFEYRLLFVPVYRYRHEAEEIWQDGCLQQLSSSTNDNGRHFEVPELSGAVASDCPASFAYWDIERLRRESLINAQTGEAVDARLVHEGGERVADYEAERYRLELDGMDTIHLWYRAEDRLWLRLETRRDRGTLVYRLKDPGTHSDSVTMASSD